jgi:hypothetical protein
VETLARKAFPGPPSASSAFLIVRLSRMPSWRSAIPGHPQEPVRLGMFETASHEPLGLPIGDEDGVPGFHAGFVSPFQGLLVGGGVIPGRRHAQARALPRAILDRP